ncbi:MAG: molybdenum cofactor biosynthesis protein MoaE [Pedobacter sp.]
MSDTKDKKIRNIFTEGPISPAFIADSIAKHSTKTDIGAHNIFLGQVRKDDLAGKIVAGIEYTAYEDMALEKMQEMREDIFQKYELTCMHVHHSLGLVLTGELCLFVFTSSKRRTAAIEACQELVERIKAELPIWGKEIFEGEGHQWKQNS